MAPIRSVMSKNSKKKMENEKKSSSTKENKRRKWINKERVLVFCQRGINFRSRHLMLDLRTLLPHSRADNKLDRKDKLSIINEVCEMKNCNKCVFFEMKRKEDLYMWISNVPNGPSARFLVENVHTMDELKLTGNCLKGARAILSFDKTFEGTVQYRLLKELFTQIFTTPDQHPKSKPFIDRVMTFSVHDQRIWIRNYQIVDEKDMSLTEIGPRFVLNLIRIFDDSFGGATLFENANYVAPNVHRKQVRKIAASRYVNRKKAKEQFEHRLVERSQYVEESLDDIFQTVTQDDIIQAKKQQSK